MLNVLKILRCYIYKNCTLPLDNFVNTKITCINRESIQLTQMEWQWMVFYQVFDWKYNEVRCNGKHIKCPSILYYFYHSFYILPWVLFCISTTVNLTVIMMK